MAPTGPAAHNIGGFTWHKIASISRKTKSNVQLSISTAQMNGKNMTGVKLIILDEINLVAKDEFAVLEERIRAAILTTILDHTERKERSHLPFAGIHFIIVGDFYQLPPVFNRAAIWNTDCSTPLKVKAQTLWRSLNELVELTHNFRTQSNDPDTQLLASALTNLRIGNATSNHIAVINSKLIYASPNDDLAHETVSSSALWLAPTKEIVKQKNKFGFQKLVESGSEYF